jgi:hypothetical protein
MNDLCVQRRESQGSEPLLLGLARDVDVRIKAEQVAGRHAAIFFVSATRRWVVQDGNTNGRTSVNGVPLTDSRQPCPLLEGFVISIGQARLEVVEVSEDPPVVTPVAVDDRAVEQRGRRRLRAKSNPWPIAFAIAVPVAVAVGFATGRGTGGEPNRPPEVGVNRQTSESRTFATTATTRPAPLATENRTEPTADAPIPIDLLPDPSIESPAEAMERMADPAGVRGFISGVPPTHPARASLAWADVVAAETSDDPVATINAYLTFLEQPRGRMGDLRMVVLSRLETHLDGLWWSRIMDLLEEEFALIDRSLQAELRLRNLSNPAEIKQAAELRAQLEDDRRRLLRVGEELTHVLGYDSGEVPRLQDTDQLRRLRAERDGMRYKAWREDVIGLAGQGRLPWDEPTTRPDRVDR